MRKLGNRIGVVQIVMMMAILFCMFLCPHSADAHIDECSVCEAGIECQDLCGCHDHQHHCELDSLHSHEFRNDTSSSASFSFESTVWVYVALLFEKSQQPFLYSDMMVRNSSHSFAIRHLDTIILRV